MAVAMATVQVKMAMVQSGGNDEQSGTDNPMAYLTNLVDVMLVFACGLMMAIVMFWNIDLSNIDIMKEEQLKEIENPDEVVQDDSVSSDYKQKGVVYQDPETGKMYLIENE